MDMSSMHVFVCYLNARIYGTDEKDVGKYDEDADVNSQHDRGAARKTQKQGYHIFSIRYFCAVISTLRGKKYRYMIFSMHLKAKPPSV